MPLPYKVTYLWAVSVGSVNASGLPTAIGLWILTGCSQPEFALRKARRFLRRQRKLCPKPVILQVKYRGFIDA